MRESISERVDRVRKIELINRVRILKSQKDKKKAKRKKKAATTTNNKKKTTKNTYKSITKNDRGCDFFFRSHPF